ncbi:MAG: FecR domain-containing protein [Deltaproteobacteria bacterium]|nr:FecR domain-containing protein [Deltaproteobacteria bacterium]
MTVAALVALALCSAAPPPLPLIPADAPLRTYVVQPGDSAWSIAAEMYGAGEHYPIIYQYNGFIGRPPYLLTPGQTLRLPVLVKGPEGKITWLRHDVKTKPPRSLDWLSAREQMNLWKLYRVSTGDASAAHIVFEDRSDLRLREEALLVIYGGSATATRTARADKREVRLEHGTLTGGLAQLDAAAGKRELVVETPAAEVGIRGRLTQIQADALASMVSALEGTARVTAAGKTVVVAQGQGLVVKKGARPPPPRPLPTAPRWLAGAEGPPLAGSPPPGLAVALPGGPPAAFEAYWEAVPAAMTYRVEVAADATFDKVLYDIEVGHGVTRLRLAELGAGTWVARVSTRDADRLESPPGPPQVVTVARASATRRFVTRDGVPMVAGLVELRAPDGMTVARDGEAGPEAAAVVLGPGRHVVTWRASAARATTALEVLDVAATLEVAGREVTLTTRDARGGPVILPGLVLESSIEGALATTVDGHVARASLRTVDAPVAVRARWAGGVLVERELGPPPAPAVAAPPRRPMLPERVTRGWARPYLGPAPTTALGLELGLASGDDEASSVLDLVVRGELALGDLGLDAGLVFADVTLGDPVAAAVGDLWLGARWRLDLGALALAPYVAATLPVGAGHDARTTTLEPGLAVSLYMGPLVRLDLRPAPVVRLGGDGGASGTGFDGLVALGVGPVAASWRARLDGDGLDHTLGLGLAVPLGAVRLGAAIGYAPVDSTWSGRLTVDVGLGED